MRYLIYLFFIIYGFRVMAQSGNTVTIDPDYSFVKDNYIPFHDSICNIKLDNFVDVYPEISYTLGFSMSVKTGRYLRLSRGDVIVFQDTAQSIFGDTVVFLPRGLKYRITKNSEVKALDLYEVLKLKTDKQATEI